MRPTDAAQPLVSCIMPTYNRRRFVPQAIHYFLRQDYAPKELIIIDDGTDIIRDLVINDERIRYFRLGEKATLGTKLNMACEYARGTMIAHWDDDDWYAPRRLSYQVEALRHEGTDICGINNLLYFDLRTSRAYQYIYPTDQRVWLLGSSLCYTKRLWAGNRFADINVGMDGLFVWASPPERITVLQDSTFSVFMIHEQNVSPKKTDGEWWHHYPSEQIRRLLGFDYTFYKPNCMANVLSPRSRPTFCESPARKSATPVRNIFACLVHESQECIIDLVRNLRYHDPSSTILLYNGGNDPTLLNDHFPFEQYGAVVHPWPRPMKWGWLHDFALDCMQFALDNFSFDILTIVDSDQLGVRSGLSDYLGEFMFGQAGIGMLGNAPGPQPQTTNVAPAVQALKEIDLWRPFLRRFSQGEEKFVHWTFWPSTVFTAEATRDLTRLFATDDTLQDIMGRSKIWATEEVVLPTLVALLGYKILTNPCSYDFVKYQAPYKVEDIHSAFNRQDVFWIHPVTRRYAARLRKHIREKFNHYERSSTADHECPQADIDNRHGWLLTVPVLKAIDKIEGWLEQEEADLLIAATRRALKLLPQPHTIVEVGSYCGRATVVLGSVVRAVCPEARVYAIDPHDGKIGALDQGIRVVPPSLEMFKRNIENAGLADYVEIVKSHPVDVSWYKPISLLLIDGLHDYANVARDFFHFEPWVVSKGYIVFHDYADYYPGVKAFVNELLVSGRYRKVHCVRSMIVLQKLAVSGRSLDVEPVLQSKQLKFVMV